MKRIFKIGFLVSLLTISVNSFAQKAFDQYGFGKKSFLIQSALEVGKSPKGIWDFPGKNKLKYDKKKKNWPQLQIWERDRGKDGKDRLFSFHPAQGSGAGRYFINFTHIMHWGINAIDVTGKVEARSRSDHFKLKYMGNNRWKIYYKDGIILSLNNTKAKNGTKIVLIPDHDGLHGQWTFFDSSTNRSFAPQKPGEKAGDTRTKMTLRQAIREKGSNKQQYFTIVSRKQFIRDNLSRLLEKSYDRLNPSEQWEHILQTIDATLKNSDLNARISILNSLRNVNVKKGKKLKEKLKSRIYKNKISKLLKKEKNGTAKKYLKEIENKF